MKQLLTALLLTAFLSACQTTHINATTGEEETNNTTSGAMIGCLGGAIAGAIINKGKGAAIGCAAAAAVGGSIGHEMDKQEELLRKELRNSGVKIKRNGNKIELVLDSDITFSTGSAQVSYQINNTLRSIVKVMNEFEETSLVISGHTDSTGSAQYNQSLSESRARAVQQKLNRYGLSRNRTFSEGYGESNPLCDNKTPMGRTCNRRVELTIVPNS